ncbi:hypothetical protein GE09DRAFT_1164053 [Coniochaeta sp. 2T2.1]|nr:hypothetical protein GE09DRAFT_1164053 [Coniochaeta sp. 2T2.1]
MDDFIIEHIEGGLEYNYPHYNEAHDYDHDNDFDLRRDLVIEQGNHHDADHWEPPIPILHDNHWGQHLDPIGLDEDTTDSEEELLEQALAGRNPGHDQRVAPGAGHLHPPYDDESSDLTSDDEPYLEEAIDRRDRARAEFDRARAELHRHHDPIIDDDSEEEEIILPGLYGGQFRDPYALPDESGEESDYGSLPSFEDGEDHDHSKNEQGGDSSQDEGEDSSSEEEEIRAPSVQWDQLSEVEEDHSEYEIDLRAIRDLTDNEIRRHGFAIDLVDLDNEADDLAEDEILEHRHHIELPSSSEEDEDDEASEPGDSADGSEASSDDGSLPEDWEDRFVDLQQERDRLQEQLRLLRGAQRFGFPHPDILPPIRRPHAPGRREYFIDQLAAPQRDANGLLAQMEMDLERGRQQRRRAAPSPHRAPPRPQQPQRQPAFIDLTGDSDSPPPEEVLALPDAARFRGGRNREPNPFARPIVDINPRRRNGHNGIRRAPSFARSDGSILGAGDRPPVIDLTGDVPEAPRAAPPRPVRRPAHHENQLPPRPARVPALAANAWVGAANMNDFLRQMANIPMAGIDLLHQVQGRLRAFGNAEDYEVEFIGENIRNNPAHNLGHVHFHGLHMPMPENPLADNPVEFNYGANGFEAEVARPKPAHIAPPVAREGFTRATGDETTVICPSCEEELKYDPDDKEGQPPPAKKPRTTKKDREEHHFWAVKACGHVSFTFSSTHLRSNCC